MLFLEILSFIFGYLLIFEVKVTNSIAFLIFKNFMGLLFTLPIIFGFLEVLKKFIF